MTTTTRPIEIQGASALRVAPWQHTKEQWSFGPIEAQLIDGLDRSVPEDILSRSSNDEASSTIGPQEISAPLPGPEELRPRDFGKRGLTTISHWEGVVESVEGRTFHARLTPFKNGRPLPAKIEYADFDFEELTESDREFVQEGAVFYWTLGRERNVAGTVANVSLLRFRRLPALSDYQEREARSEAQELLQALGVPESD
jgi:hypothetical protein